jgi:transcriptional regulator with XRE-family HTH domain
VAGLSQRAFARRAGVTQQAISAAVRDGRLIADADGLDPATSPNAAYIAAHRAGNGTNESAGTDPQVAALRAKARWMAQRLQRVVDAHVEKAAIAEGIRQTLHQLCAAAPLIPHRYGRVVTAQLGIDEDVARALLQDVADLLS